LSCAIVSGRARRTSLTRVVGCGTGASSPDSAEPPPVDRIADLPAQTLIAKLVAVPQIQQPQQRLNRHRRAAKPPVEQRPERRDEPLVVQLGVHPGQLGGQALELLRQQQLPDRGLWVALAQHRDL
jgi:hypothetical protein